ncbi:unnamed protein product, partial [Closterium sp. NIES-54]
WICTKILEEDFRRRLLRGGEEGSSSYAMQGGKRGRGKKWQGAGRGALKDEEPSNQQGGRGAGRVGGRGGRGGGRGPGRMKGKCWYCEKVGHPWFKCRTKPTWWTPSNRTQDGSGARAVADDELVEYEEREAAQFFHVGEPDEVVVIAHAGAELRPLNTWILDSGAAWTMTPRAELLDNVGALPISEVNSASGHALKVTGAGRAAFKGADGKPVVLSDVLLVPDLKANLISLRKLAKCGVSTSTKGAKTFKGQLGKRMLWDLHDFWDICRSMWQLPVVPWGKGSDAQGECDAVDAKELKVSARGGGTDWITTHRRLGHIAMPALKQLHKEEGVKGLKLLGAAATHKCETCLLSKFTRFPFHATEGGGKKLLVDEEVFMSQPPGYEDGTGRVWKLKKAIYGLKQAPSCWYKKLASVLDEIGFRASACDESLFLMGEKEALVMFLVYVDDILLFGSSKQEVLKV